jgi:alpha-galactosidase
MIIEEYGLKYKKMISRETNFKRGSIVPSIFILLNIILLSCSGNSKDFSFTKGGDIWFRNTRISLKFDKKMYCSVYYLNADDPMNNIETNSDLSKPSHYLTINGEDVKDFTIDYDSIKTEMIETTFGKGKRLILKGIADKKDAYRIEKTLWIEYYEKYPDAVITKAFYRNLGQEGITIEKDYSSCFRMDASLMNEGNQPYDFWSFQGASLKWGVDYIFKITEGFKQENYMGVQPVTETGGGVPLIDLWTHEAGLAIAHLETVPKLVSFPVETGTDKKVTISMCNKVNKTILPGESYETLKTVVIAHQLDFYNPLKIYASMLSDEGLKRGKPSEEAYEAIWCGWGYLTDFALADIYGTLPKLKELGIKWVVIDDRWWDRYGDWNPRKFTFPGGEKQVKEFVDSLHHQGFKIQIWWAPTPVQPEKMISFTGSVDSGLAQVAKDHPEWLIMDKDGSYPRDNRDMYQLCPSVPAVQEYMKKLTTRFIKDWGFDGHKLDAYYVVPPCYNPAHNHKRPEESYENLPLLLKAIYETSKSIKPYSVTEICNCGTTQDVFQSIYCDQPVNSDPTSFIQSRQRVKVLKALWGPDAPVFTDHVEIIRPGTDINDFSDTAKVGQDFATSMGPGGVIGTKFTWPGGPENVQLTFEKEKHWQKWIALYNNKMLSKGIYLNLYDIVYDKPESHLINKGENYYYAFYAADWKGNIELRGLENITYKVFDYENQVDLGTVKGPVGIISPEFKAHLLVECIPVK